LLVCLLAAPALLPPAAADPQAGKDKSKDTKEGVKKADTVAAGTAAGRISHLQDDVFTLEAGGYPRQSVDLLIADDVKIRVPQRLEFDDKGKPKPFKPDPKDTDRSKYGGMKGTRSDLREGQTVRVILGKLPSKKLVATVIIVVAEPKK
jgi:hypothetical protein